MIMIVFLSENLPELSEKLLFTEVILFVVKLNFEIIKIIVCINRQFHSA